MNFLFLMDPLETVHVEKDTSFILMLGAHARGHAVYFATDGNLFIHNGEVFANALKVVPQYDIKNPFPVRTAQTLQADDIHCVFVRSDPPFDQQYLLNTWILDRLPKRIPIINSPTGLRTVNEKIWATQFTDIVPRTLVSRNKPELLEFLLFEKDIIVKPTDGFGGASVFHVHMLDKNARVVLETMTHHWIKEVILQQYIPESQTGDKRIILLDAEPLGAVLRVHGPHDHRNNFFAGGTPEKTEITPRDHEIIETLKPHLKQLGLYFVGIDIIGQYLIEVNVTSPTGLQEMNKLYQEKFQEKVIIFTEKLKETIDHRQ